MSTDSLNFQPPPVRLPCEEDIRKVTAKMGWVNDWGIMSSTVTSQQCQHPGRAMGNRGPGLHVFGVTGWWKQGLEKTFR